MTFHESKMVSTRKEHKCEGCLEKIPKGTNVEYSKGVFDGDFYTYYLCNECREFIDSNVEVRSDINEEGFYPGQIAEYRLEASR